MAIKMFEFPDEIRDAIKAELRKKLTTWITHEGRQIEVVKIKVGRETAFLTVRGLKTEEGE